MPHYSIRRVDARDWGVVRALDNQCFDREPLRVHEDAHWWIAYYGGEPAAYAGLSRSAYWTNVGYLCRAGVLPEHRGQGLQRKLIKVRANYARRLGWSWLRTDTRDNLPSANNLIRCGFTLFSPTDPWAFKDSLYWIKQL